MRSNLFLDEAEKALGEAVAHQAPERIWAACMHMLGYLKQAEKRLQDLEDSSGDTWGKRGNI